MAVQLDALGRLPKTYGDPFHPFEEYSERRFKQRYRISKFSANEIVDHMMVTAPVQAQARGGGLSLEDKFCLGVRYLATGSNFSVVGDYQHVTKATVSRSLDIVVNYFDRHSRRYIKWPMTNAERMAKAATFQAGIGMPNCMGLIDGTHIAIRGPHVNQQAYINRHGYASLNTILVCDYNEQIMHIDGSWPGSVADAFAFNLSPLRRHANAGVMNPYYLLGDSGYPCIPNLYTPFRLEQNQQQHRYNAWHRTHRSKVERCIGLLKTRFRALDGHGGFLYHTPQKSNKIIKAAACLHNIAQEEGEDVDIDDDADAQRPPNPHPQAGNVPQPIPNGANNDPGARNAFAAAHF